MKMIVEKGSADVTNRSMRSQLIVTYHGWYDDTDLRWNIAVDTIHIQSYSMYKDETVGGYMIDR